MSTELTMAAVIIPESPSIKQAVSLINVIDTGKFPRLLSRILQKLHLKLCELIEQLVCETILIPEFEEVETLQTAE